MKCEACGRELTVGARKCVYCGSGLGQGGTQVRGPRSLSGSQRRPGSGGGWVRRIVIVVILLGIAAFAFSVPIFSCGTCEDGKGQKRSTCPACLGKGKLTPVKYLTGGF